MPYLSFFARFSNCLSLTSSFLEEDVFSTTFVAELAFVSLDFLEDDLALAVFFSFLSASAREIDSLASFLDLNCQIKLEKNYMLICNVLHEYF